jgi:hypothetical protein
VTKRTKVIAPSGATREFFESVRMYSEREMVDMLCRAGLCDVRTFGTLSGEAFGPDSKRLIVVCKKA